MHCAMLTKTGSNIPMCRITRGSMAKAKGEMLVVLLAMGNDLRSQFVTDFMQASWSRTCGAVAQTFPWTGDAKPDILPVPHRGDWHLHTEDELLVMVGEYLNSPNPLTRAQRDDLEAINEAMRQLEEKHA